MVLIAGFEPAASDLPCRRSSPDLYQRVWYQVQDSNLRPTDYRSAALPTELTWCTGGG